MRKLVVFILAMIVGKADAIAVLGTMNGLSVAAGNVVSQAGANALTNLTFGEYFKSQCAPPWGVPFCVLSAASMAQSAISLLSGSSAKKTKEGFQASGGSGFTNSELTAGAEYGKYGNEQGLTTAINNGLKDLAKKGYKVDLKNNTLTDPKGKTHSLASLTSSKAMADAGLISKDDIPIVDKEIAKMKDKFKVVSVDIANGGGGASSSPSSSKSYEYEDPYAALYGEKEKANDPTTKGLTRTLASGESIGSQVDNIFDMVHRRYQDKDENEGYFIKNRPNKER